MSKPLNQDARLLSAAPKLFEAAIMQERAEQFNANCPECGGEGDWAHCSLCSVLFGDAMSCRDAVLKLARRRP